MPAMATWLGMAKSIVMRPVGNVSPYFSKPIALPNARSASVSTVSFLGARAGVGVVRGAGLGLRTTAGSPAARRAA
jgi:hypothetical protein